MEENFRCDFIRKSVKMFYLLLLMAENLSAVSVLLFGENFELEKYTTFSSGGKNL